jgi:membrane-associated protein
VGANDLRMGLGRFRIPRSNAHGPTPAEAHQTSQGLPAPFEYSRGGGRPVAGHMASRLMFNLSDLQLGSPASYLIALVAPALDAVIPVIPSESAIIALGVATAGSSDPRIYLLVGLAAVGAFVGDNLGYFIGRHFAPWVDRRFFASESGQRRRAWAEEKLERYGVGLILVCRFIPGGRTAVTVVCGVTEFPRRRFIVATAVSAVIWACYAFFLGRIGGRAFEDRPWIGLVLALGAALVISGLIELGRRVARRMARARNKGTDTVPR